MSTTADIPLDAAVRDFILSRKLANLSPATLDWYQRKLAGMLGGLGQLPVQDLTLQVFRERLAERMAQVKPTTANHHVRAFKAFVNWLVEEEYPVPLDPRKIKLIKIPLRLPPALSPEQVSTILAQPDLHTWAGQRDYCLLSLLLDTGIRISECLNLTLGEVNEAEGTITVVGKGDKQRTVALSLPMRRRVRRWVKVRQTACREWPWECNWVFPSRCGERLAYRTVSEKIREYGSAAGIEGVRVSAHTFRSTFATHFCRHGGSIVHLQTILGHSSLEMARRYAAVTDQDAFESSRRLSPLVAPPLGQTR